LIKKTVSGIMLTLLLIGMITLAFNVHPGKGTWTGTVYIRADGSIDPPDAPIITHDNITYTLIDNITSSGDGIIVQRDNIIINGNGHTLKGPRHWPSKGICLSERMNVTITSTTVENFHYGISLEFSSNINLIRNNVMNNSAGIYLYFSSYNVISENSISNNEWHGIHLTGDYNNVSHNTFTNDGLFSVFSYNNIVDDNVVNGNPLIYLEDMSNVVIADASVGQIILIKCYNVTVKNVSISNTDASIQLWLTNNVKIMNNNLANNEYGVFLGNSQYNSIYGNNVTENGIGIYFRDLHARQNLCIGNRVYNNNIKINGAGIFLLIRGFSNSIYGNNLTNNGAGITIEYSDGNFVYGNTISENTWYGIVLFGSSKNNIFENSIKNNSDAISLQPASNNSIFRNDIMNNWNGIVLHEKSSNNIIYENNIITNNQCGVLVAGNSNNNTIYHNNFINNTQQVSIGLNSTSIWDDGYPSGGNYWSDYTGVDYYSGPYQNETGNDGIGDTPYLIGVTIINDTYVIVMDNYPLMGPWTAEGENITVIPSPDVIITFENVTSSGITTLNVSSTGPEPPSGFKLATDPPIYYNIETTANYTGKIKIRIVYDDTNMTQEEETALCLMQWNETLQQWINITTYLDTENNIIYGETSHLSIFALFTPLLAPVINATIDANPDTVNLISKGKWITVYIELPESYNISDINVSTIMLNDTVPVDLSAPIAVGDYDNDTIPDLTVCFNWTDVTNYILSKGIVFGNITLEVSGKLYNGIVFTGTDTILVSSLIGDVNIDGKVDIEDICLAALAFGSNPGHPRYNPNIDINGDNKIDIQDIYLIAKNFGKHA